MEKYRRKADGKIVLAYNLKDIQEEVSKKNEDLTFIKYTGDSRRYIGKSLHSGAEVVITKLGGFIILIVYKNYYVLNQHTIVLVDDGDVCIILDSEILEHYDYIPEGFAEEDTGFNQEIKNAFRLMHEYCSSRENCRGCLVLEECYCFGAMAGKEDDE